jgi:hypothetical protein
MIRVGVVHDDDRWFTTSRSVVLLHALVAEVGWRKAPGLFLVGEVDFPDAVQGWNCRS